MNNIFYNIVSIVVGVILIVFGILQIVKKKKLAIGIVAIVHSVLFIFLGISCFFLPDEYQFITILGMLAITITMILSLLLINIKNS